MSLRTWWGRVSFRRWEWVLLLLSVLMFVGSAALYLGGVSLRQYVLGWDDEVTTERVGAVAKVSGKVKRQGLSQAEFAEARSSTVVFNEDTLVTGPDSQATVQLDGGGTLQLAANTMVRLQFESSVGLGGIARIPNVEVVTGQVKGATSARPLVIKSRARVVRVVKSEPEQSVTAAPEVVKPQAVVAVTTTTLAVVTPESSSSTTSSSSSTTSSTTTSSTTTSTMPVLVVAPVNFRLLKPASNERLEIEAGSVVAKKEVRFQADVKPKSAPLRLEIEHREPEGAMRTIQARAFEGGLGRVILERPGAYFWKFSSPAGAKLVGSGVTGALDLAERFVGIKLLQPLVAGQALTSNAYQDEEVEDFKITFRWEPYESATRYDLALLKDPDSKQVLLTRTSSTTEITMNREKVYTGKLYYRVSARLPSGFLVQSVAEPFSFSFLPPSLVLPTDGAALTAAALKENNGAVLLTWQKTNFTDAYDLEISSRADFAQPLVQTSVRVNFYVLQNPKSGVYHWRVRSTSKDTTSLFSRVSRFTIK